LISVCRRLKLESYFSSYTNINSKWIKDLNVRPKTLKLVQERVEKSLEHIGIGANFTNKTVMAQQLRERIDKWNCMKLKSFCTAKEMVTRLNFLLRMGESFC
jgi:hypothetical protein